MQSSQFRPGIGMIVNPIVLLRKQSLREVMCPVQRHLANKWYN